MAEIEPAPSLSRVATVPTALGNGIDRVLRLAARSCCGSMALLTCPVGAGMRLAAGYLVAASDADGDPFLTGAGIETRTEIRDVRQHAGFKHSALLSSNQVRFLAGVPVPCPDGTTGGALWVADTKPGRLGPDEWETLEDLAALCGRDLPACHAESEALRFRALFEAAAIGIALIRPDGMLIEVNPALQRLTGYTAAELRSIDNVLRRLTHPEDAVFNRDLFQEMMEGRRDSYQMDKRYVRKNGSVFWGRLSASVIRAGNGTPLYVIGMVEDITERKTSRLALRTSERRYRNLFQGASDGIIIAHTDARIHDANARMCEMLGYTRDQLRAMSLTEVIAPHDLMRLPSVWDRLRAGEGVTGIAREYVRRDGSTFPVEVTVSLIERDLIQCIVRDVTARKQYEAGLIEARERAEEAARLKDTLLTNISHELRTPLATIIGCADVLHQEIDAEHRELSDMVRQGGRRLMDTLNRVVELARLEAGEVALDLRPLDLNLHVEEWLRDAEDAASARGLALHRELPGGALYAETDPRLLRRVLDHLVGNAVKFTEAGGVTVRLKEEAGQVCLQVCDTGPGISPEFLPRLFEPFQQESSGLDRAYEGTGVGLAITRLLVQLLRGDITAESRKGSGTIISVSFPQRSQASGDGLSSSPVPGYVAAL